MYQVQEATMTRVRSRYSEAYREMVEFFSEGGKVELSSAFRRQIGLMAGEVARDAVLYERKQSLA